ncbi:MAG: T9SS type A sorting domain-containing protein [Lewinella sp.]|nr:T9SS type A sorting domain-containing protein [Lewinella sp.]
MLRLTLALLLLGAVNSVHASLVLASSFGYTEADATLAFQQAIQSSFDTIVVDLQPTPWRVGPSTFFNIQQKTIIFAPGVEMVALAGRFPGLNDCLLRFFRSNDVHIIGYGASFRMNQAEYAASNDSEWRHTLSFWDVTNVSVKGLTLRNSGGDGVYVGGDLNFGGRGYSQNVLLEDLRCLNNYRQGLSIISVENMVVRHCEFSDTRGTLPEAGIDVEPDEPGHRIVNLRFEHCRMTNNGHAGLALALVYLDSTSLPVSIGVYDCYFAYNCRPENEYSKAEIQFSSNFASPARGEVFFERCFIDGSQYGALYTRKTADAFHVTFKDCVFKDLSQLEIEYNEPIFLEVPSYDLPSPALGGLTFDGVYLSYPTDYSFFRVFGWSTLAGLADVNGHFTVVEPNGNPVAYSNVPTQTNVGFTVSNQRALPPVTVRSDVVEPISIECNQQPALINWSRQSSRIDYPLALAYNYHGTAAPGDDYHLPSGGLVWPSEASSSLLSFQAREDQLPESETLLLTPSYHSSYQLADSSSIAILLQDCISYDNTANIAPTALAALYPNPNKGRLYLSKLPPEVESLQLTVFDVQGQQVSNLINWQKGEAVSVHHLPAGIYFLHCVGQHQSTTLRFVKD